MIKTNYHTHIYLCKHATGTPDEYFQKAVDCGYQHMAISDHMPLSEELKLRITSRRMNFDEYKNEYLPLLERSKNKFKGICTSSALEAEYFEEMLDYYTSFLEDVDFLILGQHYVKNEYGQFIDVYSTLDEYLLNNYCECLEKGCASGYFKIIAHPDIYLYRKKSFNEKCQEVANRIIQAAYLNNVALEINANGIRKNRDFINDMGESVHIYPRIEFWRLVADFQKEHELKVVVNDDSHSVDDFCDESTKKAYQFASSLGIKLTEFPL